MDRVPGTTCRNPWRRACLVLAAGAGAIAAGVRPCAAQVAPAAQAGVQGADTLYLRRMNAGYAAANAGNNEMAAAAFDSAAKGAPALATPRVAAGYAYLALKREPEAVQRFEDALSIDPEQDTIRRQLGFLYAGAGRNRQALATFNSLRSRDRATAADLQAIGNLNATLGEQELARSAFRDAAARAAQSGDSVVLRESRASIAALSGSSGAGFWTEYYLSPFYQQRFDNVLTFGLARAGVSAGGWWRPSAYLSVRGTRDTKSMGGVQPVMYADNSLIPALGVRVQPGGRWFTLYAEAGAAYPLVSVRPRDWHRDLRAGVIGAYANTQPLTANSLGLALVTEVYGDVSWYERFDKNTIAYGQVRESLRLVQGRAGALDVFVRGWGVFDSRSTYYNRLVEGGGGIALHAGANRRASLYIESLGGHYLREPATGQPKRNYSDFRVMFVTGSYNAFPFFRP